MFARNRQVEIRSLEGDRAPECARLHATAFPHPWDVHDFERLIGAKTSFGNAALDLRSNALIGFILCRGAAGEAEVLTVMVDANCRKQGIAKKMLAATVACLVRHGIRSLFLEVGENNFPALKLYAGFGFEEVGRRQGYYRTATGPPATALVLRKAIS